MANVAFPAFGEEKYFENRENDRSTVVMIPHADPDAFSRYGDLLKEGGYALQECSQTDTHRYAAYSNGSDAVFVNYFSALRELYLVTEQNSPYFTYSDQPLKTSATPQITQMELADFGMGYVIRLSDGRFIIIDGGRDFAIDRERLYEHLCKTSVHEKPIIAAWILSHPHPDHFHLFVGFVDQYAADVVIEKMLFLFPNADDLVHYPLLERSDKRFDYDNSGCTYIQKLLNRIKRLGLPIYYPHTGQVYRIGDARCEILASMDDTLHVSGNINAASLVIRMELGGQVILWATDAPFSVVNLAKKQGDHLRADILQIPHHGFQSGSAAGEIDGYQCIQPRVCLLPVSDYNAYTAFCAHREGTRYLMTAAGIDELITGTPARTIDLPYSPAPYAKADLARKYLEGQNNCGSKVWFFTGLCTSNPEDLAFTFLNTTHANATVWVELFFEDRSRWVRHIKLEISPMAMKRISVVGEEADGNALPFNWLSLAEQGIVENATFSVRFLCSLPMVISHDRHTATYRAQNI